MTKGWVVAPLLFLLPNRLQLLLPDSLLSKPLLFLSLVLLDQILFLVVKLGDIRSGRVLDGDVAQQFLQGVRGKGGAAMTTR